MSGLIQEKSIIRANTMIRTNKNPACQSLATEQAGYIISGGSNCPASETILNQIFENARNNSLAKIRKSFEFNNELEIKALSLVDRIFKIRKMQSSLVLNNNINIYNNLNIPTWRELSKVDKLFGICCFIINPKKYQTFTLRFSNEFIKRAYDSNKDLTSYIADRLHQNFRNNLDIAPKFMFAVEYDKNESGRFHIHGIIELDLENLNKIKHILKTTALGTNYKAHSLNRNVLRFKHLINSLGWLKYMTEDKINGYTMIYVNRSLMQEFKAFYNSIKYPS